MDCLGKAMDENTATENNKGENNLAGSRDKTLKAPKIHGFSFAGRMAGPKGKHDHCEQRINNEIDPVGRVPTAAAFVEAAFVNLGQKSNQTWGDHEN